MALTLPATGLISYGTPTALNNLSAFSLLFWIKFSNLATSDVIWSKVDNPGTANRLQLDNASSDELRLFIRENPFPSTNYVTTDSNLTTGKWWYIAVTYDDSTIPRAVIALGDLDTPATERSYSGATQDGSGVKRDDDSNPWEIGDPSTFSASPFEGDIAYHAAFNRALSIGEIQNQQLRSSPDSGRLIVSHFGFPSAGATQPDWSGNVHSATLTGSFTRVNHIPIQPWWGVGSSIGLVSSSFSPSPRLLALLGVGT